MEPGHAWIVGEAHPGSAEDQLLLVRPPWAFTGNSKFLRDSVTEFFCRNLAVAVAVEVLKAFLHPIGRFVLRKAAVAVFVEPGKEVARTSAIATRSAARRTKARPPFRTITRPAIGTITRPTFRSRAALSCTLRSGTISIARTFRSRTVSITGAFRTRTISVARTLRTTVTIAGAFRSPITIARTFGTTVAFANHLAWRATTFASHAFRTESRPTAKARESTAPERRKTDEFLRIELAVFVAIQLVKLLDDPRELAAIQLAVLVAIEHPDQSASWPGSE